MTGELMNEHIQTCHGLYQGHTPNLFSCSFFTRRKHALLQSNQALRSFIIHTSQNSFYKWTKILSLEITIFYLKMMVKSGLDFFFEMPPAPSELLLPSAKISAQNGRIGLAAQQVSLKGLGEFQNKEFQLVGLGQ